MMKKIAVYAGMLGLSAMLLSGCSSDDSKNVYVNGRGPAPVARPGVPGRPAVKAAPAPVARPGVPGRPAVKAAPAPVARPGVPGRPAPAPAAKAAPAPAAKPVAGPAENLAPAK